jgi:hypothetical protein
MELLCLVKNRHMFYTVNGSIQKEIREMSDFDATFLINKIEQELELWI